MKEIKGKATIEVYTDGKETKVFLEGPADLKNKCGRQIKTNGTSSCNETDKFDKWLGICIALGRALKVPEIRLERLANALGEKKSLVGAGYKKLGMITREQICPNGKVIYHGLRFEPKREVIGRGCIAETWAFEIDSTEIKDEDVIWRRYEIIERKAGQPQLPCYPKYSLVAIKTTSGKIELGVTESSGFVNCWVYLFKIDKIVKVTWGNVIFLEMGKDYKVEIA